MVSDCFLFKRGMPGSARAWFCTARVVRLGAKMDWPSPGKRSRTIMSSLAENEMDLAGKSRNV